MTTIKILIIKLVKKIGPPVFSFKRTQEASQNNSQILAAFNGSLGTSTESQKRIPLVYGSEFWDITRIKNLFRHHKDKGRIVDIIQKGSCYNLSPINGAIRKLDLEDILLREKHKFSKVSP